MSVFEEYRTFKIISDMFSNVLHLSSWTRVQLHFSMLFIPNKCSVPALRQIWESETPKNAVQLPNIDETNSESTKQNL